MEEKNFQNEVKDVEQNVNNVKKSGKKKTIVLISVLLILILAIGICGGYLLSKNTNWTNKNETQSNNINSNKSQSKRDSNTDNDGRDDNEVITVVSSTNNSKQMIIEGKDKNNNTVWTYTTPVENVPQEVINRGQKLIETRKGKVYLCDWGRLFILDEQTGKVLAKNTEHNIGAAAVYTFDENDNLYTTSYLAAVDKFDTNANLLKTTDSKIWDKGFYWPQKMTLNGNNLVIDYGQEGVVKVNKETLEIIESTSNTSTNTTQSNQTISTSNSNNATTKQSSNDANDYLVFYSYKNRTYKNEDYNTTADAAKEYCELTFADNGKPTIKMGYKSDANTECYFQSKEITNLKTNIAAGSTYVTFDFTAWTAGGDTTGNATIKYSNISEDYTMTVSAKVNYNTGTKEYNNIEVKVLGQNAVENFSLSNLANRVYESEKIENNFWYKIEFDNNGKPTITEGYNANGVSQIVDTYRRFTDVSIDNAAGSAYVTFSYRLLNETGDKVEGTLKYSNVTENDSIYIKLNTTNNKEIELVKVK